MIFSQYDIGDGLIQSQVSQINQDRTGLLWITTHGGISRFDGTTFLNLTRRQGLLSNQTFSTVSDKQGSIWISTAEGISIFQNNQIQNIDIPKFKTDWVSQLVCDRNNRIWGTARGSLYLISRKGAKKIESINGKKAVVYAIRTDQAGTLWACVLNDGIYSFKATWKKEIDFTLFQSADPVRAFFIDRHGAKVWMLTKSALYIYQNGLVKALVPEYFKNLRLELYSLLVDHKNNAWIGCSKGVIRVSNTVAEHLTAKNGLTDAPVYGLFNDSEKNVWLGTNGHGFFKFASDDLKIIDKDFGLADNVVTSLEKDRNATIWLAAGGAVYTFQKGQLYKKALPLQSPLVNVLYPDKEGRMWVGTGRGVGYFLGNAFKVVDPSIEVLSITQTYDNSVLIGGRGRIYSYRNNALTVTNSFDDLPVSFLQIDGKNMLMGTTTGVQLLNGGKISKPYASLPFAQMAVLKLINYHNFLLIGTNDKGIFLWDRKTGRISNCSTANGLSSDYIYTLMTDSSGVLWTGTGRGVNKIKIDTNAFSFKVYPGSHAISKPVECNTNSLIMHGGNVWVGTTKGIYVINNNAEKRTFYPPKLKITNTHIITYKNGNPQLHQIPSGHNATLKPNENNVNIQYKAIYLTDPANITYRYRLVGLEKNFGLPSKNTAVTYNALAPGQYNFEVISFSPNGLQSNKASFQFEISPPFYKTTWFILIVILTTVVIILLVRSYLHKVKMNRIAQLEQIKSEEQRKIRQQTAEDFHDDLGNKLTRISVLSDLLERTASANDLSGKELIKKIKTNAAELYSGTKHIIWSLSPVSDNIHEVLHFIQDYAESLLEGTNVTFHFTGLEARQKNIRLPYQYSRHITMLFKEALNNVLRHSGASEARLNFQMIAETQFEITLTDNGTGFDATDHKYSNGLKNMRLRAERLHGSLVIERAVQGGTKVVLKFSIPNHD